MSGLIAATLLGWRVTGGQQSCWRWPGAFASNAAWASSKRAKEARWKSQKKIMRYSKVVKRVNYQNDGDFPVQVRPARTLQIRDLQDTSLDDEASEDRDRPPPKVKPHKVREALQKQSSPKFTPSADDKTRASSLKEQHVQESDVPEFDAERDLKEEEAAGIAAAKARYLARRNFKGMPNPFGPKPGPLGANPKAEADYYKRYFDGSSINEKQNSEGPPLSAMEAEELREPGHSKPKRERISPKRFWYRDDYISPDPAEALYMRSTELKVAMVNEAHLVRKWRGTQPEGRAAGMPPGSLELWMAFGHRAAELACRPVIAPSRSSPSPQAGAVPFGNGIDEEDEASRRPPVRCSVSTTLRYLQALASVQAGPYSACYQLVSRIAEHLPEMKPVQGFFLLQALARLRMRHPKIPALLERMHLSWKLMPEKQFVKAANAAAKLDVGSGIWTRPLKAALAASLPQLSGRGLAALKSITVMELLDQPAALVSYLENCERHRSSFWYSRHLQMIEMHVHLVHPEVWKGLNENVRLFLQEVRTAAEKGRGAGPRAPGLAPPPSGVDLDDEADSSDSDDDASEELRQRRGYDPALYSSALHQDVSRVIRDGLGIDHNNRLAAGPITLDACHLPTMTAVEVAAPWQFYLRSAHVTALARRRHEMLRAMGFKLVQVPFYRWNKLEDDDAKIAFLRGALPSDVLAHSRTERLGTSAASAASRRHESSTRTTTRA
eukprot:TRINITY_DN20238_c0_g1_i1.p1 TRINITY_DN20238_c0_g1~~TRINITY_DN20238_c0_g1_i1.p1  ORF type:complete len:723 (-),score=116.48 TRINITY_DN20238_c0_g1_i1:126-2294(-)